MSEKENWISALGSSITRRTSVMTPLIILDFLVGVFSIVIYFKDGSWFLFVFLAVCLLFTLKKYEDFSKKSPWMLSSEKIQRLGMQMTLGDSTSETVGAEVLELKPVENPVNNKGKLKA